MWFKKLITMEKYLSEIEDIKSNLKHEDELEDFLYFRRRDLYMFRAVNIDKKQFFCSLDRMEFIDFHTKDAILQLLETDGVFSVGFLRDLRDKFSESDLVTAYKAILKNPSFPSFSTVLFYDAKQLSKESLEQLKEDVFNVAFNGNSASILAFYAYSYGIDDIKTEDIRNIMIKNLSTYTILLQYPKSLNAKRIHSVFDDITKYIHDPAKNGMSDHLRNWRYTPGITAKHNKILNLLNHNVFIPNRDKVDLMELFELINKRDLFNLSFSNYVHPQRSLFSITKKLNGNSIENRMG
jgi:hypothetical protein